MDYIFLETQDIYVRWWTLHSENKSPEEWEDFCKSSILVIFQTIQQGRYLYRAFQSRGNENGRLRAIQFRPSIGSATIIWKKDRLKINPQLPKDEEPCLYGWPGKAIWKGGRKEVEEGTWKDHSIANYIQQWTDWICS